MKRKRKESRERYKTHTCAVDSVEQRINRYAEKGWVLSNVLLISDDRVLLVFKLDSLEDMTQLHQMRLQMYLEAYTRIYEILSNILRKLSETNASIISNMK